MYFDLMSYYDIRLYIRGNKYTILVIYIDYCGCWCVYFVFSSLNVFKPEARI